MPPPPLAPSFGCTQLPALRPAGRPLLPAARPSHFSPSPVPSCKRRPGCDPAALGGPLHPGYKRADKGAARRRLRPEPGEGGAAAGGSGPSLRAPGPGLGRRPPIAPAWPGASSLYPMAYTCCTWRREWSATPVTTVLGVPVVFVLMGTRRPREQTSLLSKRSS